MGILFLQKTATVMVVKRDASCLTFDQSIPCRRSPIPIAATPQTVEPIIAIKQHSDFVQGYTAPIVVWFESV
jgi:hypothetical protein